MLGRQEGVETAQRREGLGRGQNEWALQGASGRVGVPYARNSAHRSLEGLARFPGALRQRRHQASPAQGSWSLRSDVVGHQLRFTIAFSRASQLAPDATVSCAWQGLRTVGGQATDLQRPVRRVTDRLTT
jgi:hypothetical protein